ncbi:hypothetical protein CALCODRAFT_484945 [Calocera cornea HHB12733]|uniref:ATP-dependent DNA helicase n=1 Tax=Calocera cornea HHB12733 TaxID=1353952 RepID=A0A165EN27_9BASI|nr:hypothetical protein CALCODRAFT_484945 [Calocera cornea HHB12733]
MDMCLAEAARREELEVRTLNAEQTRIRDEVLSGKNTFITGAAGTGKTVLLRSIIKALYERYADEPETVAVTASTGVAAVNIAGITLHAFAGVGLGHGSASRLAEMIEGNPRARDRWLFLQVLIIDEKFYKLVDDIRNGRLSEELLAKLDALSRTVIYPDGRRPTEL